MAEKISTIVMAVDLECDKCYKKIRKVLCKLQDRENIKTISYDDRSKTVMVSGPFDTEELSDRLRSDAGKVITGIHVVKGNEKPGAKAPKPAGKVNGGGGGGGKPEKKHVKFDLDDDAIDMHAHHATKPRVVTSTAASRQEAPRAEPPMSMSAMTPMPMPMPTPMPMPQAMTVPSIWPGAPEWGYSAPAYGGGLPAGGYYGGPVYDHGGYGYGRNPYQPQYYGEDPSAGCSVM